MGGYSSLVGRRVEVVYRVGTVHLLATGTLLADSGQHIFVEQHFDQHGSVENIHLKIPYHCIVRLTESNPDPTPALS